MAVTWYTQSGTPSDSVGADGDLSFDYSGRFQWGPKGLKTTGSWQGTAVNAVGPTGPGVLNGSGAPANAIGQPGNLYIDGVGGLTYLKGASTWTQTGQIVGATGAQGPSVLGNACYGIGPTPASNSLATSATPTVVPYAGSTFPCVFAPQSASALIGVQLCNSGTASAQNITVDCYNQTTSTAVVSGLTASFNSTVTFGPYTNTQYPLVVGNSYVFRVTTTGSTSLPLLIVPQYLMPSNTVGAGITFSGSAGFAAATTLTSTAVTVPAMGCTTAQGWYHKPYRSGYVQNAQATLTAAGGSSTSATATLTLMSFVPGTVTTLGTFTLTANGTPVNLGPFIPTKYPTTSGTLYYWNITGSTSVNMSLETQLVL